MMHVCSVLRQIAPQGGARGGCFFPAQIAGHAAAAEALSHMTRGQGRSPGRFTYAPAVLWGGVGRARRYYNDHADVDRRPPPGRDPGCCRQGKPDRGV